MLHLNRDLQYFLRELNELGTHLYLGDAQTHPFMLQERHHLCLHERLALLMQKHAICIDSLYLT